MQLRRKHEMNESLLILGKLEVSLLVIYRLKIYSKNYAKKFTKDDNFIRL